MNLIESQLNSDFIKNLIAQMLQSMDEGTKWVYHMLWNAFMSFLITYWIPALIVLTIIFFIAFAKAIMGRWGMLGRVLYNYLYFGILFVVGLIKGPEVFISEYFEIAYLVILRPICYWTVRSILDGFSLRR